jgi:hypothetical protein
MSGREVLGILDIIGALIMLWSNQRITRAAGISNKLAQWALLRRLIYLLVSFGLFVLGVKRLDGIDLFDPFELIAQSVILIYVIVFPLLRAFGWITQDMLTDDFKETRRDSRSEARPPPTAP